MIFNKLFQSQPEQFLAVTIFGKSASFANFLLAPKVEVKDFTFYQFSESENLTQVTRQFLQKTGLKAGVKVVFGLPSLWIEGEKIKPEFEKPLLDASSELKIEPLAFVSASSAFGFYKFWQDKKFSNFYILQIFQQKILAEYFENGEIKKSKFEDFNNLTSFDFGKIFAEEKFTTAFIFSEEDNANLKNSLNQFFQQKDFQPEIFEIEKLEFAKSLAIATAFDLGKLPKEPQVYGKDEFGFVKGLDVGEMVEPETPKPQIEAELPATQAKKFPILPKNLTKIISKKLGFGVLGVLAIFGVLVGLFWLIPSAKVEVFVKSESFEKSFEIIAKPAASQVDSQTLVIPAQVLTLEKEGAKKTVTTGKKKVGEKAAGTVTVFNKTAAAKTFPVGTVIAAPTNLKFVLVNAVTVASRSATLEGIIFGKNTVKVESVDIGQAYNLPKGTDFTFAEFDSSLYSGHSDEAFTGGTEKEVNVVADSDKKRLEDELVKELKESAKQELVQLAEGRAIEDLSILTKPQSLKFDKDVGAEANLLSLNAKITFVATIYSAKDVESLISEKLKTELPPGFSNWQNSQIKAQVIKVESDGTAKIKANFTADLIPEIDKVEIARTISGKNIDFAKNYLLSLQDVEAAEIQLSPKLPVFSNLPRAQNRIKIEIKAKK